MLFSTLELPAAPSVLFLVLGVPEKEVEGQAEGESFSGVLGGRPIRLPFFVKWFKRFRLLGVSETLKNLVKNIFH